MGHDFIDDGAFLEPGEEKDYYYYDAEYDKRYGENYEYTYEAFQGYGGIGTATGYIEAIDEDFGTWKYEADTLDEKDAVYYYYAVNTSGDKYYGYTYASVDMYKVGDHIYSENIDNDGGSWYYYIYKSEYLGYASGYEGLDSIDWSYGYYDHDTSGETIDVIRSDYAAEGLGSAVGYVANTKSFGGFGFLEADVGDSVYWYVAMNTSGDYYYGYTYDETGTYSEGEYIEYDVIDDEGGKWYYYIYDSYDFGYDTGREKYDYIDVSRGYFDADTGAGLREISVAHTGIFGPGSSTGYVEGVPNSNAWFASVGQYEGGQYVVRQYEADDKTDHDTLYYYYAVNGSGDYYYGYTYADAGSYSEGQYVYAAEYSDGGGLWYYYIYDSYDFGYNTGYEGFDWAYTGYYYDYDTGVGLTGANAYASYDGLGSSYGYLTSSGDYFGYYGFYEADGERTDSLYAYVAINASGDYYYGYTYADTGSYFEGQYVYASLFDNKGGSWYYYIYDSYDFGAETGYEGIDLVVGGYYYDYDTGIGWTSYTSYAANGGLGSAYGYLATNGSYFGYYGFYEADGEPADALYYYYAVNSSGDYYYGYTYADTGSYYAGQSVAAGVYDNGGGYWSYYVYAAYDLGYETGYEGFDWAYAGYYYDYDTGAGTVSSTAFAGNGGLGSSYGYLSGNGDYFGYHGFYEADAF